MILRRATGTDKSVKERKGLKRKFAAYAGLMFGLILTAGLFAGCGKKDAAESGNATDKNVTSSAQTELYFSSSLYSSCYIFCLRFIQQKN